MAVESLKVFTMIQDLDFVKSKTFTDKKKDIIWRQMH